MKMDFTYHIICIMSHYRCAFNFLFTVCVDVHAKATASDNVESMVAGRLSNVFYVNSETQLCHCFIYYHHVHSAWVLMYGVRHLFA